MRLSPWQFLLLRRRVEDRRGRLASALESLVGERRRPGETLLELVHRAAPSRGIEDLVWRAYAVDFAGERAPEDEKALLRSIRDARRARAGRRSSIVNPLGVRHFWYSQLQR